MQKSKAIQNVSATTAIDLKAQLAQHVERFEKTRSSTGKQIKAGKPDKKPTVWTRQNKGIKGRNEKDKQQQLGQVEGSILVKSREQLERKAKIYEAMQSGRYQHEEYENEDQAPLIDFDLKYMQEKELNKTQANKKRKRKEKDEEEDPWVEFEDEFGRTRIVRSSELPSHQQQFRSDSESEEEEFTMKRPGHDGLGDRSNMNHYEADREIRTKGVGFYSFSKEEHERQEQLAKLNALRAETENARHLATSASEKRKQMLAKNAEKIRARKAALQAKKHHQLDSQHIPTTTNINVNEDSVSQFLQSIRKEME